MQKLWTQRGEGFNRILRDAGITETQYDGIKERATRMLNDLFENTHDIANYHISLVPTMHRERFTFIMVGNHSRCTDAERSVLPTHIKRFESGDGIISDIAATMHRYGFRQSEDGTALVDVASRCNFCLLMFDLPESFMRGD